MTALQSSLLFRAKALRLKYWEQLREYQIKTPKYESMTYQEVVEVYQALTTH